MLGKLKDNCDETETTLKTMTAMISMTRRGNTDVLTKTG